MSLYPAASNHSGNNLLRHLGDEDWNALQSDLEEWSAPSGTVLHRTGDTVQFVYFPCGQSLISYLIILADGRAIETVLIGREGACGGIISQGTFPAYAQAEVQQGGAFLRIAVPQLEEAKMRSLTIRHLFARYADCLIAQVFQSVACNAAHAIEQRAAKWLVAASTRTGLADIALTQEQLASMLGVGRSYLNRVTRNLQAQGLIQTRRGGIAITDMRALRARQCECNRMVVRHFEAVLAGIYPADADPQPSSGRQQRRAR